MQNLSENNFQGNNLQLIFCTATLLGNLLAAPVTLDRPKLFSTCSISNCHNLAHFGCPAVIYYFGHIQFKDHKSTYLTITLSYKAPLLQAGELFVETKNWILGVC